MSNALVITPERRGEFEACLSVVSRMLDHGRTAEEVAARLDARGRGARYRPLLSARRAAILHVVTTRWPHIGDDELARVFQTNRVAVGHARGHALQYFAALQPSPTR